MVVKSFYAKGVDEVDIMLPAILFGMMDIVVLVIALLLIWRGRISVVVGALIVLSMSFAPHALASLVYSLPGSVNPQVVYEALPFLRTWHVAFGAVPVLMLIYAGLRGLNRDNLVSIPSLSYLVSILVISSSIFYGETLFTAENLSILSFFIVGVATFLALTSKKQQDGRDGAALRYFVWIAALSVAESVLEIALTKVRAATIYAMPQPDHLLTAYRASGLFNNPNWLGNWCALLMLCCAWCIQQDREKLWAFLGLVLGVLGIYLSGSRGAMASAGGALLVFLILSLRQHLKTSVITAVTVAATAVVIDLFAVASYAVSPGWAFAQNLFALHYRWFTQTIALLLAAIGSVLHVTLVDATTPAAQSAMGRMSSADGSDNGLASIMAVSPFAAYSLVPTVLVTVWALIGIWRSPSRQKLFALAAGATAFAVLLPMQLQAFNVFPIWIFEAATIAVILAMGFRGHLAARALRLSQTSPAL